jgi:hypothetical protein
MIGGMNQLAQLWATVTETGEHTLHRFLGFHSRHPFVESVNVIA